MPDQPLILSRGMTIVPVGNLQEQLSFLGFPLMLVDNIFGDKTEAAVQQFQASAGLEPTGVVDGETWRRLFGGEPLSAKLSRMGKKSREKESRKEESRKEESDSPELYIRIVLSLRRLLLFEDDNLVANYPVAIGKPTTPTPAGVFMIIDKQVDPGGVFGTRWMAFTERRHGIHGTNQPDSISYADQTVVSACSTRMWKNSLTGSKSARGCLSRPARLSLRAGITWCNRVIPCI